MFFAVFLLFYYCICLFAVSFASDLYFIYLLLPPYFVQKVLILKEKPSFSFDLWFYFLLFAKETKDNKL